MVLNIPFFELQTLQMFLVILVELRISWHVDVHCNLLFLIIDMKGKCSCIPGSFLLLKAGCDNIL